MTTTPGPAGAATPAGSRRMRRLRWAVRATLTIGVAASVAANILHARPHPVSQIIAAWPPLALLFTVELISRVPVHNRHLGTVRLAATAAIAGIAAWVSYWHMAGVAAHYGETGTAAYLLPLSVDGLVIVASISLVDIAARIRTDPPLQTPQPDPPPNPHATATPVTRSGTARQSTSGQAPPSGARPPTPGPRPSAARPDTTPNGTSTAARVPAAPTPTRPAASTNRHDDSAGQADETPVPGQTADAVAYWYRRHPDMHPAAIATRIGRSERTVRRYWPPDKRATPLPPTRTMPSPAG